MKEMVPWWQERLDEDERVAHATTGLKWTANGPFEVRTLPRDGRRGAESPYWAEVARCATGRQPWPDDAFHIARHDPERVLADVEADRRLVEIHFPREVTGFDSDGEEHTGNFCNECAVEEWPCRTLRIRAGRYATEPGYREEWRPSS